MLVKAVGVGDGAFDVLQEALVLSRAFNVQCADLCSFSMSV